MGYDSKKIGERIYLARQNAGLKQLALSIKAGISQSTLSEIESGKAKLTVETLYKISETLGASITWLLGENSIPDLTDSERLEMEKYKRYIISIRRK
jgi:transcriptional regulator with XRE-family HTH domain